MMPFTASNDAADEIIATPTNDDRGVEDRGVDMHRHRSTTAFAKKCPGQREGQDHAVGFSETAPPSPLEISPAA